MFRKKKLIEETIEKIEDLTSKLNILYELLKPLSPALAQEISEEITELNEKKNKLIGVEEKPIEAPEEMAVQSITTLTDVSTALAELFAEIAPEVQKSLVDIDLTLHPVALTSTYLLDPHYAIAHGLVGLYYKYFVNNPTREKINKNWPALRPIDKYAPVGMVLIDQPSVFERYYFPISEKIQLIKQTDYTIPVYTFTKIPFVLELPEKFRFPYVMWTPVYSTFGGIGLVLQNIHKLDYNTLKGSLPGILDAFGSTSEWKIKDTFSHIFFGAGGTGKSLLLLSNALFGEHYMLPETGSNYRTQLIWVVSNFEEFQQKMRYDLVLITALFDYLQSNRVAFANKANLNIVGKFRNNLLLSLLPLIDNLIMNNYGDQDVANNAMVWETVYKEGPGVCLLNFTTLDPSQVKALLNQVREGKFNPDAVQRSITVNLINTVENTLKRAFTNFKFSDDVELWKMVRGIQVIITLPAEVEKAVNELRSEIEKFLREKGVKDANVVVTGVYFVELPPVVYTRIFIPPSIIWKRLLRRLNVIRLEADGKKKGEYFNSFSRYLKEVRESLKKLIAGASDLDIQKFGKIINSAFDMVQGYLEEAKEQKPTEEQLKKEIKDMIKDEGEQ